MSFSNRNPIRADLSNSETQRNNSSGVFQPTFSSSRNASDVTAKIRNWQHKTVSGGTSLVFPEESIKYYFVLEYSSYQRLGGEGENLAFHVNFQKEGSIALPLPAQGINDTHEVEYEEVGLGMAAGAAATSIQAISDTYENTNGILDSIKGYGKAAGDLAASSTQSTQALFGKSPNKFMTILLRGPKYKRHEFVWKLYPSNKRESDRIRNIILRMNNCMAVGTRAGGLLWDFPYIWQMYYVPNNDYLYKFKPAVIESLTSNYVPAGVPSFYADRFENPPECVEIRARFLELEYWLRNQFDDRLHMPGMGFDDNRSLDRTTVGVHDDLVSNTQPSSTPTSSGGTNIGPDGLVATPQDLSDNPPVP